MICPPNQPLKKTTPAAEDPLLEYKHKCRPERLFCLEPSSEAFSTPTLHYHNALGSAERACCNFKNKLYCVILTERDGRWERRKERTGGHIYKKESNFLSSQPSNRLMGVRLAMSWWWLSGWSERERETHWKCNSDLTDFFSSLAPFLDVCAFIFFMACK